MRPLPAAAAAAVLALAAAGCSHTRRDAASDLAAGSAADANLSQAERDRKNCKLAFAACAPPANFDPDTKVDEVGVRALVQISWRLDLSDDLSEKAAARLRTLAERGDDEVVREISYAAEAASATLGRCRCEGDKFRPEYEKQGIAEIVARRLPAAELRNPAYWADRIDPHLVELRKLSRRSAELLADGDEAGRAALDAQARARERELCQEVHGARAALSDEGMIEMRELVYKARARASGDASVEMARRTLERAEGRPSCAASAE